MTDCGAACLATISKQHGLKTFITRIREVAGTDKQGTNAYGMIKAEVDQLSGTVEMELAMANGFFELSQDEMMVVDGGDWQDVFEGLNKHEHCRGLLNIW